VLLRCHAGCETAEVLTRASLRWSDLFPVMDTCDWGGSSAEYAYEDEQGSCLFIVCRKGDGRGKRFRCLSLRPDGSLAVGARSVRRVLYHLPEVLAARAEGRGIYLCEGEKDADAMRSAYGVAATTNPFGATAWARDAQRFGYAESLRGAVVIVVQHRDACGRRRTRQLLASLEGVAASVSVVEAAAGNDAADHVAAGGGLDDLRPASAACEDDGRFAALPDAFFEAAAALGLTHLEYRVLVEVARHSVRRVSKTVAWQALTCPSSWLARCCGAAPTAVRSALGRLERAGVLVCEQTVAGQAKVLSVNDDYASWRPLVREVRSRRLRHRRSSPVKTGGASSKDSSTREDLGVREERVGGGS
jgi:hypothetical protein